MAKARNGVGVNGAQLRDVSSPETIAAILVGLLAVVLVSTQTLAGRGERIPPVQAPSASIASSSSPTMDPALRNALTTALVVNQRLAGRAIELEAAVAAESPLASEIAALLRSVNTELTPGHVAAGRLLLAAETAELGADLAAVYDAVRARNAVTLRTSVRDLRAYIDGARAIMELLASLPVLDVRLADALEGPPGASAAASPSPSTSNPSPAVSSPPRTLPPASPATAPPSPSPSIGPSSLVVNGDFEDGLSGWQVQLADGAEATLTSEPAGGADGSAAARVDISFGSQARSGISLTSLDFALGQGATYTVALSVRADAPREVRVRLTDGTGQTTTARVFPVGTTWTVISFEMTQLVADPSASLSLDLGRSDATVWFDNVVVHESPR